MTTDVLSNNLTNQNLPSDPLFNRQWHLQNTTPGLLDLNVVNVWDDYTEKGVHVAVIDDAVQGDHADLDQNYLEVRSWDFEDNDNDANPSENGIDPRSELPADGHGTNVAGLIGAVANNGLGGVGIAYDSTIAGFKTFLFQDVTAAIDSSTFNPLATLGIDLSADVLNMSIGNSDGSFFQNTPVFDNLNQAINDAAWWGRNQLGTIMVKSAGNARNFPSVLNNSDPIFNQDTNTSSWNANPHTISVAAVDQDGFISSYSTHGASLLVSAFGTPQQVVTTDREGMEGSNRDLFNNDHTFAENGSGFAGTSAAAPMVSGVVALMLEANPDLGWRDVQEILAYSARHVGSSVGADAARLEEYTWNFNGADNWNGGGLHFSNDYGFGLVDAKAAVRLAETWGSESQTSRNATVISQDFLDEQVRVSDWGFASSQVINDSLDIEHVEVDVSFTQWVDHGDLVLRLLSPSGTSSILINQSGNNNESFIDQFNPGRWTFVSNEFRGEDTTGVWTVELFDVDDPEFSPIIIDDIDITFHGQTTSWDDTFIFTEEYSDYAGGLFGHSQIIDGGVGVDTINAAAVDSDTVINLTSGTGQIDEVVVSVVAVEDVVSGDGNDQLVGNHLQNNLSGMRGSDLLIGGAGSDRLDGGDGDDDLIGVDPSVRNAGQGEYDILTGGDGADIFVLGDAFEAFYSGGGHALITDFDGLEGDLFWVHGAIGDYSLGLGNVAGELNLDTLIYYNNDLVGVVQDNTDVVLNADFAFA